MASKDESGSDDEPRRIRGRPRAGVSKPDETSRTEAIRAKNRRAQKAYRLRCKDTPQDPRTKQPEQHTAMDSSQKHVFPGIKPLQPTSLLNLEQLDQLEASLAERRKRMTDMHEHRGRLTRRQEQLQQELTRSRATLRDLRIAAQGILEDAHAAPPEPECVHNPAPPAAPSPEAEREAAAEAYASMLRSNLEAIQQRHAAAQGARAEARSCGMPIEHSHFDNVLQASGAAGYAQLQEHFGMH